MNKQRIIQTIIKELEYKKIEVVGVDKLQVGAVTNVKKKITLYCPKTITAFKLCHELMHIKNKDYKRMGACDFSCPQEVRANREAVLYLWKLFQKEGGKFADFPRFIDATGCPADFARLVVLKATSKEYTKEVVEERITDYVMHTDEEPKTWNIYRILDTLHIKRQWELTAAALLAELALKIAN